MRKHYRDPQITLLKECLERFPLRYMADHTGIGKSRLHRLRHAPLMMKMHELVKLRDNRFIAFEISIPAGCGSRREP